MHDKSVTLSNCFILMGLNSGNWSFSGLVFVQLLKPEPMLLVTGLR